MAYKTNVPGSGWDEPMFPVDVLYGRFSEDPVIAELCRRLGPILAEFGLSAICLPDDPAAEEVLTVVAVVPETMKEPVFAGSLYVRLREAFGCPVYLVLKKE